MLFNENVNRQEAKAPDCTRYGIYAIVNERFF